MTNRMNRRLALGATSACLVSVLLLMGLSYWTVLALMLMVIPGVAIVAVLVEMGIQEVQGRRRLRQEQGHE